MSSGIVSRNYSPALWASVIFIVVGILDGFPKLWLMHQPAIYFWIFDVSKWWILPLLLMLFVHQKSTISTREYGLSADFWLSDNVGTLPAPIITLFIVSVIVFRFAYWFIPAQSPFNFPDFLPSLGPLQVVGTFYFAITAGLWESIFCIGLPWLWFSQNVGASKWQGWGFGFALALLFGLCHWENGLASIIGASIFQLYAFRWYLKLKTLWPIVVAHVLIDLYYFWPSVKL